MAALTLHAIVDQLHDAGLNLSLAPAGGLAVTPASHLTADLRDLIRGSKALLIDWLTAANDAATYAPEPPDNPKAWRELDAAYLAHHFHCPTCMAASRGTRYGLRCGAGAAMWRAYTDSASN